MNIKNMITLAFAAALFGAVSAHAQTETWKSLTDAAGQETNLTKQIQLLQRSLQLANTSLEKFDAHLSIAKARYQQGNYGDAVYYAEEAVKIADAEMPNDSAIRTKAVFLQFRAMQKIGKEDKAWQLLTDNTARTSAKSDHIWVKGKNGPLHRFTSFSCPNFIVKMPRVQKTSYNTAGTDVGCGYELIADKYNKTTVFFAGAGKVSDEQAIAGADGAMLKRLPAAQKIASRKNANFNTGTARPVYYTLLTTGTPQSGEQYTGAWSQVIGGWVLSGRITWDSAFGINFGAEKMEAVFDETSRNVRKHFGACEALETPKNGKRVARDKTIYSMLLTLISTEPAPEQRKTACYAGSTSGNEVTLGYHPNSTRIYSTYSAVISDEYYVEKEIPLKGINENINKGSAPRYVLKMTKDGTESFYQVYDGEPNANLVFEDIIGVVNGTVKALGSLSVDENGNSNISINSDDLGGERTSE